MGKSVSARAFRFVRVAVRSMSFVHARVLVAELQQRERRGKMLWLECAQEVSGERE